MQFTFDNQTLDTERRELLRDGAPIPVQPQVFDLLVYLVQNRDRVVSKEDLIGLVWGGRTVSDSTFTSRVNAARTAVGDSGRDQKLIRTISRKGLRFVGTVQEPSNSSRPADRVVAKSLDQPPSALPLPDRPAIAVLPFNNMSGEREQEYFSDGISEDIITALSKLRWFFVIARNSSFTYKGKSVHMKQVAEELGVRYVLEGSVRKLGNRVRITGQLIDTANAAHIWAERYDRALDNIFAVQDELTMSVVGAIEPNLRQAEIERAKRKRPDSLDAYDLYLRALPFATTCMPEDADKALPLLERAISFEPDYAIVHAMIAWCHEQRYLRGGLREETRAAALRHARAAIAAGGDDAPALAIGGFVMGIIERDRHRARRNRPVACTQPFLGARLRFEHGHPCLEGRRCRRSRAC